MATQTLTLSSSLGAPNKASSPNLTKAAAGPCSVFVPQKKKKSNVGRPSRLLAVRAQAAGDKKDESVDVHVTKNNTQGSGTAVERRPRRLGVDISPFGMYVLINYDFFFFLLCSLL